MKTTSLIILLSLFLSLNLYADAPASEDDTKSVGTVLFLLNPAKVKIQTDYTPETMVNLIDEYRTRALNGVFLGLGINTGYIEMDIKKDSAKLTFFTSRFGTLEKAMKMKISPEGEEKRLEVKARIPFCQMRELYGARDEFGFRSGRWKFSKDVERELERALEL
jgi:hypothetical protein